MSNTNATSDKAYRRCVSSRTLGIASLAATSVLLLLEFIIPLGIFHSYPDSWLSVLVIWFYSAVVTVAVTSMIAISAIVLGFLGKEVLQRGVHLL